MAEEWKDVECEPNYEISNYGNIRHKKHKKIVKQQVNIDGYLIVSLNSKTYRSHRLVAKAFIPNPDNKPQINHINANKKDNRVENLEWCDCKHNIIHAYNLGIYNKQQHKLAMKNYFKPVAKIKDGKIIEKYDSLSTASEQNFVTKQSIYDAIKKGNNCVGYKWKYIGD